MIKKFLSAHSEPVSNGDVGILYMDQSTGTTASFAGLAS